MAWRPRFQTEYKSVLDYLRDTTGMTEEELVNPQKTDPRSVVNLEKAAGIIMSCIQRCMPIIIAGDYDCDGVTSSCILYLLLRQLGGLPEIRIPRRISEGYGINSRIIDGVFNSLIICVDNGIAATEVIAQAKRQGNTVVILDHHLLDTTEAELPPADAIVDPHVVGVGQGGYQYYCGAGLALKLSELMLGNPSDNRPFFYSANVLAAIGTLADVMPLTGENRRIVKDGLAIANNETAFSMLIPGVQELLRTTSAPYDEEKIQFSVAPMINSVGRLYDAGALSAVKAILCDNPNDSVTFASKMKKINDKRKDLVKQWTETAEVMIQRQKETSPVTDIVVLVLNLYSAPEGIMGIIAGKLSEKYNLPAIVVTQSREDGILKGSGRSPAGFNLFDAIQHVREFTTAAGGHESAAGLSIRANQFFRFVDEINVYARKGGFTKAEEPPQYFDIQIEESEAERFYLELRKYAPYGEGCRKPVFAIRPFVPVVKNGNFNSYRFMGAENAHLKLFGAYLDVIAFNQGAKYTELKHPEEIDVYGSIETNTFNGKTTLQFNAKDIEI